MLSARRFWFVIVLLASMLFGCGSAPQRAFSDSDLLIDSSVMPDGWSFGEVLANVHDSEGQESGASVGFFAESPPLVARALEHVYCYSSSRTASRHYNRFEATYFNDDSIYRTSPWQVPPGFTFSSASADQWRFGCAGSNFSIGPQSGTSSVICDYLAQHDEFLVFFGVTIEIDDQSFMTLAELATVIEAIDQKMSEHLGQASDQAK